MLPRTGEEAANSSPPTELKERVGRWWGGGFLSALRWTPGLSAQLPSRGGKLKGDKLLESLQVLGVKFDVVVTGSLHPQGLDSTWAALVHGQAMGEVNNFVLRTMDHQHWGGHLGYLVNTEGGKRWRDLGKQWFRWPLLLYSTYEPLVLNGGQPAR